MKEIRLGNGQTTKVDDCDFDLLSSMCWQKTGAYARSSRRFGSVAMHRLLLGAKAGVEVDHINRDRLDNQRSNLRLCTRGENGRNCKKASGKSSPFKGVTHDTYKSASRRLPYRASISVDSQPVRIGNFRIELHAAMAYDIWAREVHGEFAHTNFPASPLETWSLPSSQ